MERRRAGRSPPRGPGDAGLYVGDLSSLASVRAVAAAIIEGEPRLDVLIHNAGGLLPERKVSEDGHEVTFATMVLGPFVLTRSLVPLLSSTPSSRVLWIASGGMYTQTLDVGALEMTPEAYKGATAYARAKRAQVVLSEEWAKRLREAGVVVHAMHPGWADTPGLEVGLPGFRRVLGPLLRTPDEGADTIVWLAAAEEPGRSTGKFWLDRAPRSTEKLVRSGATPDERARLVDHARVHGRRSLSAPASDSWRSGYRSSVSRCGSRGLLQSLRIERPSPLRSPPLPVSERTPRSSRHRTSRNRGLRR